jgi:hypothetical protein
LAPRVLPGRRGLKELPAIPVQKATKETWGQLDQLAPGERLAPRVLQLLHLTVFDRLRPTVLSHAMLTKPWYRYFALRGETYKARDARSHRR